MENLRSGIDDIKETASVEIKNLLADVEELVARIADMQDSDLEQVRSKVQRTLDAAKQHIAEGADSVKRQAQGVATTADDYIRENPWQAVGLAALVGAVLGTLLTRRS